MEKKRRARINHCLNELKTLILEAMKKDVSVLNAFLVYHWFLLQLQFGAPRCYCRRFFPSSKYYLFWLKTILKLVWSDDERKKKWIKERSE